MVKTAKQKGSIAERELIQMFWGASWAAIRVAGSGSSQFPCMDVLAGNGSRNLAVECKSTKYDKQYFKQEQIKQLEETIDQMRMRLEDEHSARESDVQKATQHLNEQLQQARLTNEALKLQLGPIKNNG